MEIAIIGFGPWGLSVLERLVDRADEAGVAVRVHIVDPGAFGGGVYSVHQPDYLILNNPCGQLSLSALTVQDRPYAVDFYQWVTGRGYRWVGNECRITTAGRRIEPSDYLPRRLLGEYLTWFLDTMVGAAPPGLEVVRHPTTAIDIVPATDGREQVLLENGNSLTVEHVVLTSGHTFNKADPDDLTGARYIRPYPVDYFETAISPGDHVAVSGMGLVAFDILTALTIGRGGSFVTEGGECRYLPSGREPVIEFYSRSGIPPSAKSATGIDSTGDYRPAICTPEALTSITRKADGSRRQADFRLDLLPLLTAEMQVRYQTHRAFLHGGATAAEQVRCDLARAWLTGHFDQAVGDLSGCGDVFDPTTYFPTEGSSKFEDADDYEQYIHALMERDLREALAPGGSPIKAAEEVTRILRDDIRSVVEFGGLSLESYLDFQSNIRSRITRLDAGPPPMRIQQLLSAMDAGVARIRLGPSPSVDRDCYGRTFLVSSQLATPDAVPIDTIVRGHLDMPSLSRSASPLLNRLSCTGRLTQLSYNGTEVGSVAITEDFQPIDLHGRPQPHISVLGVLTEGTRYFTHYLPSPKSRIRAVLDAQRCVESVIS